VAVEHAGTDPLGARLAFELKETLGASTLFELTRDDVPKVSVILRTSEEFPGRPGMGTVWSAVWIYSAGTGVLAHFLDAQVGVAAPGDVETMAGALAQKTDEVAGRYAYLFEE
jgi:hypothetical protein